MKDKFIKFMKKNHAFQEFLEEIHSDTIDNLNTQFKDGGAEFVLCDGAIFFYKDAKTDIDWGRLNRKWVEMMKEEEVS